MVHFLNSSPLEKQDEKSIRFERVYVDQLLVDKRSLDRHCDCKGPNSIELNFSGLKLKKSV